MDDREWTREKLFEAGTALADHEARIASLETYRENELEEERERFRQRPSWVNIFVTAVSVIVAIITLYVAAHQQNAAPQPPAAHSSPN